jgi:hypothetical protein
MVRLPGDSFLFIRGSTSDPLDAHIQRVDAIDAYHETIVKKGDRYFYKYGNTERPVITSVIKCPTN